MSRLPSCRCDDCARQKAMRRFDVVLTIFCALGVAIAVHFAIGGW